jgi:hypothetical protein
MKRLRLTAYMSVLELAERLGHPTDPAAMRRLKRQIRAKERSLGQQILMRLSGRRRGPLLTTETLVRHHMPELISTRDEMAEALRKALGDVEEKLEELTLRDRAKGAQLKKLLERLARLENRDHP